MDVIYEFHCRFHYGFHCKFHANSTIFHCQLHDKFHYIYQDFTEINKISWNPQHLTEFHWNQQDFIMDFTVDSISVKSVMKFIMKSANEIYSEIHNEILLISVKSVEFNEILWNPVDFMTSCGILWISWNLVVFSKILLGLMDLINPLNFLNLMKFCCFLIKLC